MYCRVAFKVYTNIMDEEDVFKFLDTLGVEAGITEGCLYFGLSETDTEDENFIMTHFIHECISSLISKKELLRSLKDQYNLNYILDVKFSNIEEEIERKTSFNIDDELKCFLQITDTYFNLNDGYFEE